MKVLLLRPSQYCKEHNTAVTNRYKRKVKATTLQFRIP